MVKLGTICTVYDYGIECVKTLYIVVRALRKWLFDYFNIVELGDTVVFLYECEMGRKTVVAFYDDNRDIIYLLQGSHWVREMVKDVVLRYVMLYMKDLAEKMEKAEKMLEKELKILSL